MVKKLLVIILVYFMLSVPGVAVSKRVNSKMDYSGTEQPIPTILKSEILKKQIKEVHATDIINPNVELSKYKLIDGVAYLKITDINDFTAVNIWEESFLLKKLKIKKLIIYINSTGGNMLNAHAIVDVIEDLKKSGTKVEIEGHGMVASAAVPVFVSGSKRIATRNTVFLLHPPKNNSYGFTSDSIKDLKAKENIMSMLKEIYVKIVSKNSNLSTEKISSLMNEDTWFTAEQAQKWGMIDELR